MLGTGATGWIGNTGYGLGDTLVVGYSERLHALLSPKLDGTMRLGQALAQAKQEYIATLGVVGPYDAKVVMQTTLYALPMLRLGTATPPGPPPPPPLSTDPATGLQSADFDVSPTFTAFNTVFGRYYRADDGVQLTQRRPIEPLVSLDVTQPGLQAHGALIRLLNSPADELNFNAAYSRVVTDHSEHEPELVGETAFPTKIQHISTYSSLTGLRQRLNLIVGLFRSDGLIDVEGIGTHRRYTRVAGKVLYSNVANDWRPPQLGQLQTLTVDPRRGRLLGRRHRPRRRRRPRAGEGGRAHLPRLRRHLAHDRPPPGHRQPLRRRWAPSCLRPATRSTTTSRPRTVRATSPSRARRSSCSRSSLPPDVVPEGAAAITSSLSGTQAPSGWYRSAVQVTLTSTDPVSYSLDGGAPQDYTGPFLVTGDGVHLVEASTQAGARHTTGFVIDGTGPAAHINRTPLNPDGAGGWYVFNVHLAVSAADVGGSSVQEIRCVLDPAVAPASFAQIPPGCAYLGNGADHRVDGVHKLYAAAIDDAGNPGAVVVNEWKYDSSPPLPSAAPLASFQTAVAFPVAWSATDSGSGAKSYDVRYRTAPSNSSSFGSYTTWLSATTAIGATFTGTPGNTTCFSVRARDFAFNTSSWSSEVCTTSPLDDDQLSRSGSWTYVTRRLLRRPPEPQHPAVVAVRQRPRPRARRAGHPAAGRRHHPAALERRHEGDAEPERGVAQTKQLISF